MPWLNEPSLETSRQGLAAVTSDASSPASGYVIYAIGGDDGTGAVSTVEAYDTLAKSWSTTKPMITPRLNLAVTSGPGRIYALGGSDGAAPLATHEIYDPAADAWSAAPSVPTARSGLAAVTDHNGMVYALGGFNGTYLASVEAFNPASNLWNVVASMPTARSSFAAVTGPDGQIYAIGGQNSTGDLGTVEIFNPATNSWTTGPSLPATRFGLAAAVGPDGLVYAMGGYDGNGFPQTTVYSYDPAASGPWTLQPPMLTPQGFLAAGTGPDGLIYAIGGQNFNSPALGTVEAYTVGTGLTKPDPYIGDGTYQSPDIILLDSSNNPVPIGGRPGGVWDTLLIPNTHYGIKAIVYNDSTVPAANTIVRFWHFPGGVGTVGAQIDVQTVTIPASSSFAVTSANPFKSGGPGEHECVAVSVANPASSYFSTDPTTATAVIDPTAPHPANSDHFGSAWRNTNSISIPRGGIWNFPFRASLGNLEPVRVKISVTANKVAKDWDQAGEAAGLRKALEVTGADLRMPLFMVPELRAKLPVADLKLAINLHGKALASGGVEQHVTLEPGIATTFKVSGTVPADAVTGDLFLLNVAAQYPATSRTQEAAVEYLEFIYVK